MSSRPWAWLLVVLLVGAGAGYGVGRGTAPGRSSSTRAGASAADRLGSTTTTTSLPPPSPPATGAQKGSARSFMGRWRLHSTVLFIDASGYGILNWRTYATCGQQAPPCDIFSGNDIVDGGFAAFTISASGDTASGRVLTSSVPAQVPLGPFTARLDQERDLLQPSFPLFHGSPLCGPRADALSVGQQVAQGINCGA